MNEITQILEQNEKTIFDCKPEYAPYIVGAIIGTIITMVVLGIFAWSFFKSIPLIIVVEIIIFAIGIILNKLAYDRTHYLISDRRVIIQSGIIGRDFKSIDYDKMQNVSVSVGLLGVIFKVGTIKIFTGEIESVGGGKNQSSTTQPKYDELSYIASPYEVLKKLQDIKNLPIRGKIFNFNV